MAERLKEKTIGFYLIIIAAVAGIVAMIWYTIWAPSHNASDIMITVSLILGILIDIILLIVDEGYLVVLSTAAYSVAALRLLTNSVGSFADAIQGINMFGDSTQVGTVIGISAIMLASVILMIVSGFTGRVKEN